MGGYEEPFGSRISIHALLVESDSGKDILSAINNAFLSTLSLWRATRVTSNTRSQPSISIHALLVESDDNVFPEPCGPQNFYPRSPCGERPL